MTDSINMGKVQVDVIKEVSDMMGVNLRPCLYKNQKCLFHGWTERRWLVDASTLGNGLAWKSCSMPIGLVENQLGQITEARPSDIRFIDDVVDKVYQDKEEEVKNLDHLPSEEKEV